MRLPTGFAIAFLAASTAAADEGMWLFNNPPTQLLQQRYNFTPARQWLHHVQRSSVRFNSGGSGSLISADGLVFTNHHVAADCLQKIGTASKDYINAGFRARTHADEVKCPDEELNVLMSIEDVTQRVQSAVTPGMDPAAANQARRGVINTIEKESLDKTGLRSDVVTLYNGGRYHLYRFKRYTDVRLVFAPERSIAFFGGDPDNFEYPRYDLDIAFFRVYENGKPAHVDNYLKWNPAGAQDGELVFVSGHPGGTSRMDTMAHLEFLRDMANPYVLNLIRRREVVLSTFSTRSLENARRAQDDLFGIQNARKAYIGRQAGLLDPSIMQKKQAAEKELRDRVMEDPKLREQFGGAWNQVEQTLAKEREIYVRSRLLEDMHGFYSHLFWTARTLVRLAAETQKPNAQRLREYSEAGLPSLKEELFSEAPIYKDLERVKLADSLTFLAEQMGVNTGIVQKALAGKSPQERAAELVNGTKLDDVAVRKQLAEGGEKAIEASNDPMIQLARAIDPAAREVRKILEERVIEPRRQAYGKIANARFAIYGTNLYPDATFTLRLSFGAVKGYTEQGKQIPWTTTIGGTFKHAEEHGGKEPFNLPKSWLDARPRLKPDTPFNFVSTADIIGGNSGSPVINRAGELVGIIFDGNIQSLVLDYIYTDEQARAVSVDSAGILEALRTVYKADGLVREIMGGTAAPAASGAAASAK